MSHKHKDLDVYHGHRVVNGEQLRSQFEPGPDETGHRGHLRRRILHGFMLTLLVAIVVLGVGGAWAVLTGRLVIPQPQASAVQTLGCPSATFDYSPPESVHVNVFNAAGKEGLAKTIGDQLAQRKFAVGTVDNEKAAGSPTAVIVAGPAGESAAFTVQRHVPGSVFRFDGRGDATVDLILLPSFKELKDPGIIDQTPGTLLCEGATPSPLVPVTPPQ
ncbi:LytR C-terminal domain-containing protein [Sinomonas sp. G460-2]|uniref:LytR C-terminal domain-containing protein n=1 Tax=Sinomonas sp. G460-2 TaxID=3393464 RepID=UPI0039F1336D